MAHTQVVVGTQDIDPVETLPEGSNNTVDPPAYDPNISKIFFEAPQRTEDAQKNPKMLEIRVVETAIIKPSKIVEVIVRLNASEKLHVTRIRVKFCAEERATVRSTNRWSKDMVHETITKFFDIERDIFGEHTVNAPPHWEVIEAGTAREYKFHIEFPTVNYPPALRENEFLQGFNMRYILTAHLDGPNRLFKSEESCIQFRPKIVPRPVEKWVYETEFCKKNGRKKLEVYAEVDQKSYSSSESFKATLSLTLFSSKLKRREIAEVNCKFLRRIEGKLQIVQGTAFNDNTKELTKLKPITEFTESTRGHYDPISIVIPLRNAEKDVEKDTPYHPSFVTDHIRILYEVEIEVKIWTCFKGFSRKKFSIPVVITSRRPTNNETFPAIHDYRISSECPRIVNIEELPLDGIGLSTQQQQEQQLTQENEPSNQEQRQLAPILEDGSSNQPQQEQPPAEENEGMNQQMQEQPPILDNYALLQLQQWQPPTQENQPLTRQTFKTMHLTRLTGSHDHLPKPRIVKERFDGHW